MLVSAKPGEPAKLGCFLARKPSVEFADTDGGFESATREAI
jgi:hypothetical protein